MSDKLPTQNTSDEIDLGQLFNAIGKVFNRIGDLIVSLFSIIFWVVKKIGVLLLILLNIFIKHFLLIIIACGITYFALGYFEKQAAPIYQSNMIISQNYKTGKLLYGSISRYNSLAQQEDSVGLSNELGISVKDAAQIVGFDVYDYMPQNQLIEDYYEFVTKTDSLMTMSISDFADRQDLENYKTQNLFILSKDPTIYKGLSGSIINMIESNEFFKKERNKEKELLQDEIDAYSSVLKKSDSLQEQYMQLLKSYYGSEDNNEDSNATVNLNLSNKKEKVNTKEFELFEEQKRIKLKIAELKKELKDKDNVVRLQKDFTQPVIIEGKYSRNKINITIGVGLLIMLFFLAKEFKLIELINLYGQKDQLLENK